MRMTLSPIALKASLHEVIWGGQNLAAVAGKTLPPGAAIGESWETALDSVAINEPYARLSLGELTQSLGTRLYGLRSLAIFGPRFPLLAKFLDANMWLSVQTHPDDRYAAAYENGKLGKTEAWRILAATENASVIHGFREKFSRNIVEKAIADNQLEALMHYEPVRAGDTLINLAGTVHATGAGIVLYEIQEYSDVTYRLYDYGRVDAKGSPRELHITKGLDVSNYNPLSSHICVRTPVAPFVETLTACRHFALQEVTLPPHTQWEYATTGASCHIVSVIGGGGVLRWESDEFSQALEAPLGQTFVVPAEPMKYFVISGSEAMKVLVSYAPEENDPYAAAWLANQSYL